VEDFRWEENDKMECNKNGLDDPTDFERKFDCLLL